MVSLCSGTPILHIRWFSVLVTIFNDSPRLFRSVASLFPSVESWVALHPANIIGTRRNKKKNYFQVQGVGSAKFGEAILAKEQSSSDIIYFIDSPKRQWFWKLNMAGLQKLTQPQISNHGVSIMLPFNVRREASFKYFNAVPSRTFRALEFDFTSCHWQECNWSGRFRCCSMWIHYRWSSSRIRSSWSLEVCQIRIPSVRNRTNPTNDAQRCNLNIINQNLQW